MLGRPCVSLARRLTAQEIGQFEPPARGGDADHPVLHFEADGCPLHQPGLIDDMPWQP
jgi:hypothetical protein